MPTIDAQKIDGPARKALILGLLESENNWCSGEALSARLGISRAAVSKHINALKREGHAIVSAPRRGYRLRVKSWPVSFSSVKPFLRTSFMGRRGWRCLPETDSTNNEGIIWAAAGAAEGALVMAEQQTGGKGRKGRAWFSAPRGLAFSLVLRPEGLERAIGLLTSLAVVAVAEAVSEVAGLIARPVSPNDVAVKGRKIAGILVETGFRGPELDWAVLGIGCNVNALSEDFPLELQAVGSSLLIEGGGRAIDRSRLLAVMLERLEYWYAQAKTGRRQLIEERWRYLETVNADEELLRG